MEIGPYGSRSIRLSRHVCHFEQLRGRPRLAKQVEVLTTSWIGAVPVKRLARGERDDVDFETSVQASQAALETALVLGQQRQDGRLETPKGVDPVVWHPDRLNEEYGHDRVSWAKPRSLGKES
jgi:hypothetical protein